MKKNIIFRIHFSRNLSQYNSVRFDANAIVDALEQNYNVSVLLDKEKTNNDIYSLVSQIAESLAQRTNARYHYARTGTMRFGECIEQEQEQEQKQQVLQQEKEQHSSVVDVVYDLYTTNGNEENYNE